MFGGVGSCWGHDHPHILFWLGLPFLFLQEIKLCHHYQDFLGRTVSVCLTIVGEKSADCVKVHGMGL